VIQTSGYLSSAALVPVGARSNFIASIAHYEAVARRIVAALHGAGSPIVLLTGSRPINPQVLSDALGNVGGPDYAVIIIACGPELTREDLEHAVPTLAEPKATSGAAAEVGCSAPVSPLFVFADFDRLSDSQIEDIFEGGPRGEQIQQAAVLLAPLDFLARLERPAMHFLKEHIAAQFRFQQVGDDEAIASLHNQLLAQRDRRTEARSFRRGILIGLAAGGIAIGASIGVFILYRTAEQACEAPASTGQSGRVIEEASMLRLAEELAKTAALTRAAENVETTPAITNTPAPLSAPSPPKKIENPPATAPPAMMQPPAGHRPPASEITALLARGDVLRSTGDITSARLFYERAADAGSGLAALRLGATFEPVLPTRAGLRATADPAQALFWYRRARELGVDEAEQRIKALDARFLGERNSMPSK